MSKLFIIGNGFDSAHKMPTSYEEFRKYIIGEYELSEHEDEIPEIPDSSLMPDGEEFIDPKDAMRLAVWLLSWCGGSEDCEWKEFESNLASLDYESVMDENTAFCDDPDHLFWEANNYEMIASNLQSAMQKLPQIFEKWVETIPISKNKISDIVDLFNDSCYFLTFNYTETLEVLYGIPEENVCHIHGKRGGRQSLLVGHGVERPRQFQVHIGADHILQEIDMQLKKDTIGALKKNNVFFQKLANKNITEIYSYGFSFSDVDMIYIKKICSDVDTDNVIWYLNDFGLDDAKKSQIEEKIYQAGFNGKFGVPYHIHITN